MKYVLLLIMCITIIPLTFVEADKIIEKIPAVKTEALQQNYSSNGIVMPKKKIVSTIINRERRGRQSETSSWITQRCSYQEQWWNVNNTPSLHEGRCTDYQEHTRTLFDYKNIGNNPVLIDVDQWQGQLNYLLFGFSTQLRLRTTASTDIVRLYGDSGTLGWCLGPQTGSFTLTAHCGSDTESPLSISTVRVAFSEQQLFLSAQGGRYDLSTLLIKENVLAEDLHWEILNTTHSTNGGATIDSRGILTYTNNSENFVVEVTDTRKYLMKNRYAYARIEVYIVRVDIESLLLVLKGSDQWLTIPRTGTQQTIPLRVKVLPSIVQEHITFESTDNSISLSTTNASEMIQEQLVLTTNSPPSSCLQRITGLPITTETVIGPLYSDAAILIRIKNVVINRVFIRFENIC